MRTIGNLIKQTRIKRKISVDHLSQKTKIKPRYIWAIEKEEWQVIPNFTTAAGFVRNIAQALSIDTVTAVALLRRDFQEFPKMTVSTPRVFWTPKTTTILLLITFCLLLVIYLTRQYLIFIAPPPLSINTTRNGEKVEISGKTSQEAGVLVNGEAVLVDENGSFTMTFLSKEGDLVKIEALSRSGKATTKEITIQ